MKNFFFVIIGLLLASNGHAEGLPRFQDAGRASIWDAARSQCQALGAGWDLPTLEDYGGLLLALRAPVVVIKTETGNMYPMWVRGFHC